MHGCLSWTPVTALPFPYNIGNPYTLPYTLDHTPPLSSPVVQTPSLISSGKCLATLKPLRQVVSQRNYLIRAFLSFVPVADDRINNAIKLTIPQQQQQETKLLAYYTRGSSF
jgi:hypothetical protein